LVQRLGGGDPGGAGADDRRGRQVRHRASLTEGDACVKFARRPAGNDCTVARDRILVIVLAGGAGGRLELLTERRAKPAVPFAGTHRLIDFPLSNCHNAGLADVWVAQQFNPISLSDHLANGRPWDLDRTSGGLLLLQPRLGHDEREGFQMGTADSLWRNAPMVREFAPEALVVVSADAVYALDYGKLVEEHARS